MRQMTEKSLREAFAGESQAHMRYLIFAEQAEKEGLKDVARLLEQLLLLSKSMQRITLKL